MELNWGENEVVLLKKESRKSAQKKVYFLNVEEKSIKYSEFDFEPLHSLLRYTSGKPGERKNWEWKEVTLDVEEVKK